MLMPSKDITGQKFGKLTAITPVGSKNKRIFWSFLCECGVKKEINPNSVKNGSVVSCGCWKKRRNGLSTTRSYQIWFKMIERCNDIYDLNYGGRGIKVCERWKSFDCFYEDMGEPLPNMSLDRIDNDGNYEQSNCRWASASEQLRNTRRNVYIEFQGQRKTISDWADFLGIKRSTLWRRLKRKLPLEKALQPRLLNARSSI
jgi:hypothetical protein